MTPYTYEYPRPMVTVDVIVLATDSNGELNILLVKRKHEPYKNHWALPGGFVDMHEDLPDTAMRELYEETGLKIQHLEQFRAYGAPGRDPRGRTITIVYYTILDQVMQPVAGDDAQLAQWFNLRKLPALAFDHKQIIDDFVAKHLIA